MRVNQGALSWPVLSSINPAEASDLRSSAASCTDYSFPFVFALNEKRLFKRRCKICLLLCIILRTRWRREEDWAGYKLTRWFLLVTSVQSSLVHCLQVPLPWRDIPSLPPCPTTGCITVRSQSVVSTGVLLPCVPTRRKGAVLPLDQGALRTETKGCSGNGAGFFPFVVAPRAGFGAGAFSSCLYKITDADRYKAWAPPQQSACASYPGRNLSCIHPHTTTPLGLWGCLWINAYSRQRLC